MFSDEDIAGSNSNTALLFYRSQEYSTEKVVSFWRPPSFFSPWSPSSFVVDDVPYSCSEQYIMADETRLFQDHRAVELILSSPTLSTCKRIGRGVRNFDPGVEYWEKRNAVLSGIYDKCTQNPVIKQAHFEL